MAIDSASDTRTFEHISDVASTFDNQAAIAAMRTEHGQLADRLTTLTQAVIDAAAEDGGDVERVALYGWYRNDLLPHVKAEEVALYSQAAALDATALLVKALIDEHGTLRSLIDELAGVGDPAETMALAASGKAVFEVHLSKEDTLLLPALEEAGIDLSGALEGMRKILDGDHAHGPGHTPGASAPHADHDPAQADDGEARPQATIRAAAAPITGTVELDVRALPHRQRHDVIFATLSALSSAGELVIVNDHDPLPLRYQADALWPGAFQWTYRESGPEVWKVAITAQSGIEHHRKTPSER